MLEKNSHTREQTTAATGNENIVGRCCDLLCDFDTNRALAGNHFRIIKRM